MKKILLIASVAFLLASCGTPAKSYDNLTACLEKNQVVMFGASWCPHCASQKKLFLKSVKDLPYFECAVGSGQVQECIDRDIASYPTWQFTDATIKSLPPEALKNLLNGEFSKVKGTTDIYRKAVTENKPELLSAVDAFQKKTNDLMASKISDYEKLTKLTVLTDGPDETLIDRPVYRAGRIAGERSLTEVALYAGCSDAYQMDMTSTK